MTTTKIDLDELERKARAAAACGDWYPEAIAANLLEESEDAAHVAANSPPVTLALIARIRELEFAADRAVTIADEAFGLGPVESADATLGRIERGINEQHKRIRELEAVEQAARAFVKRQFSFEAVDYVTGDAPFAYAEYRALKALVLP